MGKCPEKELLENFIDYGLTEEMNEKIFTHLSLCSNCRDTIRCLLMEDEKLLKGLLRETVSRKHKATTLSEPCLSPVAIFAYASASLNEDQLKLVESHLEKCDDCLSELIKTQKQQALSIGMELDMSVLRPSENYSGEKGTNVIEVILKAKDNLLGLVRHTGELLSLTPQLGTIRGKEQKTENPIIIRKDFPKRDLSLQITIGRKFIKSGGAITISAMKLSSEEFVSGLDVSLSGGETYKHSKTDKDGIVEFSGIKKGKYAINVTEENVALITIR